MNNISVIRRNLSSFWRISLPRSLTRKDWNWIIRIKRRIWDVFRGQKTAPVLDLLKENNIMTEYVPNNMTNYYQPLDCITNKWAKDFLKPKFSTWFSNQVQVNLDKDIALEDIDIKFQLTTMKPLHASWQLNFGQKVCRQSILLPK